MIRKEALSKAINIVSYFEAHFAKSKEAREDAVNIIEALEQELCEDMGEVSDGYHTFNQLYHQRAVLFATIVNQNKDKSWKSFKHSDGNYCFDSNGEWFIVGVDTPKGSYTYHYSKEYWNMFDCEELECGKEWDGHTEEDVTRLLSLQKEPCTDAIRRQTVMEHYSTGEIANCHHISRNNLLDFIEQLPPVNPAEKSNKWIPVSERLPKGYERVLVTRRMFHWANEPVEYTVGIESFSGNVDFVAWMPLPEPYKASPTGAEGSDKE